MKPSTIITQVSRASGVPVAAILGKRRSMRVVRARHVAMWAIRERLGLTYVAIGALFNRDHSSCVHAVHRIEHAITLVGPTRALVSAL